MFKSNHYVPILKWKGAERKALEELNSESKKRITPLIQFIMPTSSPSKVEMTPEAQEGLYQEVVLKFEDKLPQIPAELLKSWGKTQAFIDFSLIYSDSLKSKGIQILMDEGGKLDMSLIPVLHLSDSEQIVRIACSLQKKYKSGLCLRLVCSDLVDDRFHDKLRYFLESNDLSEEEVDLLVDIQYIEKANDPYVKYFDLSQKIPHLLRWRTYTFASGAFPIDLSGFKLEEDNLFPRIDLENWLNVSRLNPIRTPSFSDYAIQHPIYKEATQLFSPTASIRYTLKKDWWIMKGRRGKYEDYLTYAKLLSSEEAFFGESFSYGDRYIVEKSKHYDAYVINKGLKGTGNSATWLAVGINHHLECTVGQIASSIA